MTLDFTELAVAPVRTLPVYQPGKPDSELRRELGVTDIVKLASNENPLGPSPRAQAVLREHAPALARYPDGNGYQMKAALAARLAITPDCITLGNGSDNILEMLARAFLDPDREAVYSEHAFAIYSLVVQATGARARIARPLGDNDAMPYGHDLDAMRELIGPRTRLVFIANPNNPTGTWLSGADLQRFLATVPSDTLVVIDEAYHEYVEADDYTSAVSWLQQFPNLVVTRTFSKIYGLAALRVGYSVSHPAVAELLNRVRSPFNVNAMAQAAATAALDDVEFVTHSRAVNRAGMAQLSAALQRLGLRVLPSATNFLCVDLGRPAQPVYQRLLEQGVIVRPVASYGLPHHLRVTIGTETENQRFLTALQRALGAI